MKKIFISYRRQDSAIFTGRLYDRLVAYYGSGTVFLDIDGIRAAATFPEALQKNLSESEVVLAIIGKNWAGTDPTHRDKRRIDNEQDFVRLEIEQAIKENKKVIPVYFDQAEHLSESGLPSSLRPLVFAQSVQIDIAKNFNNDVASLRREVNRYVFPTTAKLLYHLCKRFVVRNSIALCLAMLAMLLVWLARDAVSRTLMPVSSLHRYVADTDPVAFQKGANGRYLIARGLTDREMLVNETDIEATIRETKHTFDVFSLTGGKIALSYEVLNNALNRGVHFRFVLVDHGSGNEANLRAIFEAHGTSASDLAKEIEQSRTIARQVITFVQGKLMKHPKGNVELKVWKGQFLNSIWIRDSQLPENALGHIEVSFYGDSYHNPSLRFGRLSPSMTAALNDQFEYIWSHSDELSSNIDDHLK